MLDAPKRSRSFYFSLSPLFPPFAFPQFLLLFSLPNHLQPKRENVPSERIRSEMVLAENVGPGEVVGSQKVRKQAREVIEPHARLSEYE